MSWLVHKNNKSPRLCLCDFKTSYHVSFDALSLRVSRSRIVAKLPWTELYSEVNCHGRHLKIFWCVECRIWTLHTGPAVYGECQCLSHSRRYQLRVICFQSILLLSAFPENTPASGGSRLERHPRFLALTSFAALSSAPSAREGTARFVLIANCRGASERYKWTLIPTLGSPDAPPVKAILSIYSLQQNNLERHTPLLPDVTDNN